MKHFENKVALVTGGGRGLGRAICEGLAESDATVLVADHLLKNAEAVVAEIRGRGGRAKALSLDVRDHEQIRKTIEETVAGHGGIDYLINNAGVDETVSIEELSLDSWDRIMATNLRGPFILSKSVLPHMREKRSGHILNVVSTAAKRAWPNASAYHASKWGLLGFTHALHSEARPHGVKVTALVVGGMRTPFLLERFPDIDVSTLQDPANVATTIKYVLSAPGDTVIPEVMVLPMKETSWP